MATTLVSPYNYQTTYGMDVSSGFTFVDFLPCVTDPAGFFKAATFENFRTLIDRANDWLRTNRKWKIVTCESVEFKSRRNQVDISSMSYYEHGESITLYVRGLRLWLSERQEESEREQQIGYINLLPQQTEAGGIFTTAKFETLDCVLSRFNSMLHSKPIPGRVITIESQEMKLPNFKAFDPDRSNWQERGDSNKHYVFILRIFYEVNAGYPEEIGLHDFVPLSLAQGGIFSLPKYEPFSNVINRASAWCSQQQGIRICNIQSLEMKVKRGKEVNTLKMDYTEHGSVATFYVRVLRIAYTKSSSNQYSYPENPFYIRELTCRSFMPVKLVQGMFIPEYENLYQTKERVMAWVKATGARVISAETVPLRTFSGGEKKYGVEASFTYDMPDRNQHWVFVIRLYLDGVYREPPPEALPPIPELQGYCCAIL